MPLDVLMTTPFSAGLLDRIRAAVPGIHLHQAPPESADYRDAEVLYCFTPPADLARAPKLRWVQLHLAGVNALYGHPLYASALPLTTASGVHATAVAEYTMTVLLAYSRRIPGVLQWQAGGAWPPDERRWELFVPAPVRGATIGILGYGSIGREVARLAKAFGMRVLVTKRDPSQRADRGYALPGTGDPTGTLPDVWYPPEGLQDLLRKCDYVVNCLPMTPATAGTLGAPELQDMKPTAYLVNVGRGGTVDEAALADALCAGRIAGAALDVFAEEPLPPSSPLWSLTNVLLSAHVSGFTPDYDERCTALFIENLQRYLRGDALLNLVDRSLSY